MKKIAILLVIALCLTLCGCPATETDAPPVAKDVHITAGRIEPGMTAKDVLVEVTLDREPIACRVTLTGFTATGYYDMEEDEAVPEDFYVRLNVYYSLPKGYDVGNINVTMDCDGGAYDGTGSTGEDDNGCIEAWSYAFYGELPEEPTEPQPTQTQPTEPQPTETQPTEPSHTHSWTEKPSFFVSCTSDSEKTFVCDCGETKTETVPAPGHDLKEGAITPPTCTEKGRQTNTCKRCGAGFINEFPATGHSWSAWTKKSGTEHEHTCSVCGEEESEKHSFNPGSVTCTGCGEDIVN